MYFLMKLLCQEREVTYLLTSLFQNIEEFGAKEYFTDYRTSNTIHDFRDSVSILKIHVCF